MKTNDIFVVAVGSGCNNNCLFCLEKRVWASKEYVQSDFVDASKKYNGVQFSAGEPTVNPKLIQYVKMAKLAGFEGIELETNGRMLSVFEYAQKLADAGVKQFRLSIHGSRPEVHDALTRTPGSFEQSLKGLKNLSKLNAGIRVTVVMTVLKQNYKNLPEAVELFLENGADHITLNVFNAVGAAKPMARALFPKYASVEKIFASIIEKSPNKINVDISLPVCVMRKKLRWYCSRYDNYFVKDGKKFEGIPVWEGRIFIPKCKDCAARGVCVGVWPEYIELFGDSEFRPLLRSDFVEPK